jgi:hypothetical protein
MAKSKKPKSALPYVQRLLEDEYVQEQLRDAASGLRAVYQRARTRRTEAAEDKRLYGKLRKAATSVRRAATALQRPKPKPKRRLPKLTAAAATIGGGALLATTRARQKQRSTAASSGEVPTQQPQGIAPAGSQPATEAPPTTTSSTT